MTLFPSAHVTTPDGVLTTIQDLSVRVDTLDESWPVLRRYTAQARRTAGPDVAIRLAVFCDRKGKTIWRARVK